MKGKEDFDRLRLFSLCFVIVGTIVMILSCLSPLPFLHAGDPLGLVIGGVLCGSCTIPITLNAIQVLVSRNVRK